ncbi:MAG: OB-fold domain-containing protein [Chloroflexota bacterium]|nr:OB-fold domain-containing protein [Chloroflexota bacterium]
MAGITSYGAYIPWLRIDRKIIFSAMGWLNPGTYMAGEKAVANYDEDSITMAVAAATDALKGTDPTTVDGLYLATTTSPFKERQDATIVSAAIGLGDNIRTADFTDSTKAGTTALLAACDAVKAGSAKSVMVAAADSRLGKSGSSQEMTYGDGAAALLVGDSNVIATLQGSYTLSCDFTDHWRADGDRYDRSWEDRWIRDEGYTKLIPGAISGLLKKYNLDTKSFAKIVYSCPYPREHAGIGKALGIAPEQLQPLLLEGVGDTGTASSLMMLVAALEEAKPGDKILVANYGFGCEALFLEVTPEIEKVRDRRGIKGHLSVKNALPNYEKYASFRNLTQIEKGIRGDEIAFTQLSTLWRERKAITGLYGSKCKACGTPMYPPQRVCVKPDCGVIDDMEPYRFADKKATLFTYTGDNLAFSPSPPGIYGMVNFDGGGRYWFDVTDCDLDSVKVDMPVEMTFRKKYVDPGRGIHGYFWKISPIRQ